MSFFLISVYFNKNDNLFKLLGVVGDVSSESLGGRSNNVHMENAFNANAHNKIGKETSNGNVYQGYNTEEKTRGVRQESGDEHMIFENDDNHMQMKTTDEILELKDMEALQDENEKVQAEIDTEEMQDELKKVQEEIDIESPMVFEGDNKETDKANKAVEQNDMEQPAVFDNQTATHDDPKLDAHHEEQFDPEVLELFEDHAVDQEKMEYDPEMDQIDALSFNTHDGATDETIPEVINMERGNQEFIMEKQIAGESNLEVAGTDNFNTFKTNHGFEDNMQEFEQVSDIPVDTEDPQEDQQHFPDNGHFINNEHNHGHDEEVDFSDQEDYELDEHDDEPEDILVTEEDVIDLMYEDRHLSPYRKIFKEHFGSYPDEEELLHLYKQVAGDIFSLDNTDDEKEQRWKIYSEVYLHHFKESHLRILGYYPNAEEVFHFQKIFHRHRKDYKTMDPEELRFDAEFGHLPNYDSDDPYESKFDIPEVNDEVGEKGGEEAEMPKDINVDPTGANGEDSRNAENEDLTELDPTDIEEEEEEMEMIFNEMEKNHEVEADAIENKDTLLDEKQTTTGETKETANVMTQGENKEIQSNENYEKQELSGKTEDASSLSALEKEDLQPSHPEGTEEINNGQPDSHNREDETKEHQQAEPIDITERNEDGNVPVRTHVDSPSPVENKGETAEAGVHAIEDEGMPASGSVQTGEKDQPVEELGESSGPPENIMPVPTSLEDKAQPPSEESKGNTVLDDGVTSIVNKDVTTVILDGTTMIENENGPEVLMTAGLNDQVEPSANIIENTPGQPLSVPTPDLNTEALKPTIITSSEPNVQQAESTISHSQTQHNTLQPSEQTDSLPLGQPGQQTGQRDDLQASGSQQVLSQEHDSIKTNNGIETEPIVPHAGQAEVTEIGANGTLKEAEGGAKGPDAHAGAMNGTNESTGEASTGGTFTRPDDALGKRVDPYSPSGEYVSRSLQSHQPSANVNQPEGEPDVHPQANIDTNVGGGAPKSSEQTTVVPEKERTLEATEQSNDNLPSRSVEQEVQSPPTEGVTPPVVPEVEDVMPDTQQTDTVTEPTPIVEKLPDVKEPETLPPVQQETQQTDTVTEPTPVVEELPDVKEPDTLSPEQQETPPTDKPVTDDQVDEPSPLEDLPAVGTDFPPLEDNPSDPYATDEFHGRKVPDETGKKDEEEPASEGWVVWYARKVDGIIGVLDPVLIAVVESVSINSVLLLFSDIRL